MGVVKKKNSRKIPFALFLAFGAAVMVCNISIWVGAISSVRSTPTPQLVKKTSPLELTLQAIGKTQTAVSLPTATATNTPTDTLVPTVASTATLAPTRTFTPAPTATLVPYVAPTQPALQPVAPSGGSCSCNGDSLNCGDFGSHSSAQSCFDYCISVGAGDIHKLDGNNDGNACESLP